jgi:hypothetical protein
MSRNFTSDVDTQREYFNASYFNKSETTQIAKYETTLLKPFFQEPDQWKLAINRFRLPLSGIPLTNNNIPFNQWQIGIQYSPLNATPVSDVEYVKQFNEKTSSQQTLYSITNTQKIQTVLQDLQDYTVFSTDLLPVRNDLSIPPQYDAEQTLYLVGQNNSTIFCYNITTGAAIGIVSLPADCSANSFYADSVGNLYISVYNSLANTFTINQYNRTTPTTWTASTIYDTGGVQCTSIYTTAFNDLLVGTEYGSGTLLVFYIGTPTLAAAIEDTAPTSAYCLSRIPLNETEKIYTVGNVADKGQYVQYRLIRAGGISAITLVNVNLNFEINRFLGFDYDTNLLLLGTDGIYYAINPNTGAIAYNFLPIAPTSAILPSGISVNSPINAGGFQIFTYQEFLNQINSAFESCYQSLKTELLASFLPTQAPSIVFNPTTKLFSLVCEGLYTTLNSDGSNQYKILMNNTLWNNFYFPAYNTIDAQTGLKSIIVANYGINAVAGNGSITLPQFIYINQESSTIYAFNDLTRIIVATQGSIPVSGDGEGVVFTNTGSTTNNSINIITDIIPDTSVQMNTSPIIYVPNGILRWYNLYAQQPFSKIDLIFYYETKDGIIRQVEIINGEYFSVKLEFKKGPGDF